MSNCVSTQTSSNQIEVYLIYNFMKWKKCFAVLCPPCTRIQFTKFRFFPYNVFELTNALDPRSHSSICNSITPCGAGVLESWRSLFTVRCPLQYSCAPVIQAGIYSSLCAVKVPFRQIVLSELSVPYSSSFGWIRNSIT